MSIEVVFEVDAPLLRVKAIGKDENLEQVVAYGMQVIEAALSHNCAHILCDETELIYAIGTIDTYESAVLISEAAPSIAKVAIVCNPDFYEDAAFWENVAVNRGLSVRAFKNMAEAEAWIQ